MLGSGLVGRPGHVLRAAVFLFCSFFNVGGLGFVCTLFLLFQSFCPGIRISRVSLITQYILRFVYLLSPRQGGNVYGRHPCTWKSVFNVILQASIFLLHH